MAVEDEIEEPLFRAVELAFLLPELPLVLSTKIQPVLSGKADPSVPDRDKEGDSLRPAWPRKRGGRPPQRPVATGSLQTLTGGSLFLLGITRGDRDPAAPPCSPFFEGNRQPEARAAKEPIRGAAGNLADASLVT